MTDPDNRNSQTNPVGRFMVAAGAVIELGTTGKILLVQRSRQLDWHPGEWEITYGRIAQFESPEEGLRREIQEELGLTDIEVGGILRVWHIYRGSKKAENDLVGITYRCKTLSDTVVLSDEHEQYTWVTPEEALSMIHIDGIRKDVECYSLTVTEGQERIESKPYPSIHPSTSNP